MGGGTGGPRLKVWTRTKILSPNICYFVAKTMPFWAKHPYYIGREQKFWYPHIRKSNRWHLNSQQNSVCSGLKFSSESKLFGVGPPCHRPTSATPILNIFNLVKRRKREEKSTFFLSSCSLFATWSTSTEKSEPSPRPQYIRPEVIWNFKQ